MHSPKLRYATPLPSWFDRPGNPGLESVLERKTWVRIGWKLGQLAACMMDHFSFEFMSRGTFLMPSVEIGRSYGNSKLTTRKMGRMTAGWGKIGWDGMGWDGTDGWKDDRFTPALRLSCGGKGRKGKGWDGMGLLCSFVHVMWTTGPGR